MEIYIVIGATGEYSDRTEWLVCAHKDEELAKDHVLHAEKRAKEIYQKAKNSDDEYDARQELVNAKANQYDQSMEMDYTGTRYFYEKCNLIEQGLVKYE